MYSSITIKQRSDIKGSQVNTFRLILFSLLHILLALGMHFSSSVSTIHAILTITISSLIALTAKDPRKIFMSAAYICGAEVLWRMTDAQIFWEFGKYAVVAIMLTGILQIKRIKDVKLPLLYFLLLMVSIPLTIFNHGFNSETREMISFNLSGPLVLAICAIYFSQVKLDQTDLESIAWSFAIPVISILTIASYSIFTAKYINFVIKSNLITSGGFGPNQVSAVLGLGSVMMFIVVISTSKAINRLFAICLMLVFLAQSALTFS